MFHSDDHAPASARRFVTDVLCAAGHDAHVDDAQLVTSELVTNAVKHTTAPRVEVSVALFDDHVRIEVADIAEGVPQLQRRQPTAVGGLGLVVVEQIAQQWGVDPRTPGKTVWCVLPLGAGPESPAGRP